MTRMGPGFRNRLADADETAHGPRTTLGLGDEAGLEAATVREAERRFPGFTFVCWEGDNEMILAEAPKEGSGEVPMITVGRDFKIAEDR